MGILDFLGLASSSKGVEPDETPVVKKKPPLKVVPKGTLENPTFVMESEHAEGSLEEKHIEGHKARFKGEYVYCFSLQEMKKLLRDTGYVMVARQHTGSPHIDRVCLAERPDLGPRVSKLLWTKDPLLTQRFNTSSEYYDNHAYITSRILSRLNRECVILSPRGRTREYDETGPFRVILWSTPAGREYDRVPVPENIWNAEIECENSAFRPHRNGAESGSILIEDGNYAVAELLPNALYIHHDLDDNDQNNFVLAEALDEAVQILCHPSGWHGGVAAWRAEKSAAEQARLAALIQGSIPDQARKHRETIEQTKMRLKKLRQECFDTERMLHTLLALKIDSKALGERLGMQLIKLQRGEVAHIRTIQLEGSAQKPIIRAYTDELRAIDPTTNKTHVLGRFEILLAINSGDVRFYNVDFAERDEQMQAPHVDENGHPCLGNIEEELPKYVCTYEIEAALTLAIAFLQSVNPEDSQAVETVKEFPTLKKGKK